MMAKSQEQRWAEGYYGALVGLTVRKVEVVVNDDMGYPELWPTITMVADDGEEFVIEVSRDPEGNGAGFLFGLPAFSAPECEVKQDADRNAWWAPFDKMCDEVEGRIGQRPFVEHTGGGCFTVCLPVTPDDKSGDYGRPLICTAMYNGPDDETGEGVYEMAGATLSVFPSSDGAYCSDLYMDAHSDSADLYERWSDFEETFRHMVEDRYDDFIGHDAMVEHHIKVWETWKRERHLAPEGVVTGLEVTA
jgi:hypothetical protein